MQYRRLGKTDWQVSVVSMGAWALGNQWGELSDAGATATVRAGLDAGINLFDTADNYGPLLSEQRLGKALGGDRANVYIATKVGHLLYRQGHPQVYTHPLHVVAACHGSLHRLGTDYIDIFQCHDEDPPHPEIYLEGFELLRQQGKIRHFGISSGKPQVISAFDQDGGCATAQIDYSAIRRAAEREALPLCAERDIGTLIRGALGQGVLTGKYSGESKFADSVRGQWNSGERRRLFLAELAIAEEIAALGGPDRTIIDLALAFVLAQEGVTCAIAGAKSADQATANASAAAVELTADELEKIRALSAAIA